jgi:predicted porin
MTQKQDALADDKQAWTVGSTLKVGGFEAMAQYSDAEGAQGAAVTDALEWNQYVVQAGYRFAGTTLVSANYSELEEDGPNATAGADKADRTTVGVYHDVNSNLKLVAEYTKVENDANTLDQDIISLGGFVFF